MTTQTPPDPSAPPSAAYANLVERNINGVWVSCILNVIEAAGIRRAVTSPGGRSAAMLLEVHRRKSFTDLLVSTDERTGAFSALGMIKATGAPAMVVTTSGSAVANLVPALTEADECNLPLVLVTCDRPRSLRNSGFGQMIDHEAACRAFVRASVDLPDPVDDVDEIANVKRLVAEVLAQRDGRRPGPVHINIPFAGRYESTEPCAVSPSALREAEKPVFLQPPSAPQPNDVEALIGKLGLRPGMKGLIVAGPECCILPDQLITFAARTGFPVLADAASGLRGTGHCNVLSGFDVLAMRTPLVAEQPDLVIRLGFPPVTPMVTEYLLAHPCPTIKISRVRQEKDYLHPAFEPLVSPGGAELEALGAALERGDAMWCNAWRNTAANGSRVRRSVVERLPWGEVPAAQEIFRHDTFEFLHLGNSMPVRHADIFYDSRASGHAMYSNRGVWGIDGTIGTFLGEAIASGQRGLLVLGDQAFIHDLPALANAQRYARPACICVINNGGGAIFDFLPLSKLPDYETVMRNPYHIDVGKVAESFGLRCARCEDSSALRAALDAAAAHDGVTVVEVIVPPGSAALALKQVDRAMRSAESPAFKAMPQTP